MITSLLVMSRMLAFKTNTRLSNRASRPTGLPAFLKVSSFNCLTIPSGDCSSNYFKGTVLTHFRNAFYYSGPDCCFKGILFEKVSLTFAEEDVSYAIDFLASPSAVLLLFGSVFVQYEFLISIASVLSL
jgi:hypothetical protein